MTILTAIFFLFCIGSILGYLFSPVTGKDVHESVLDVPLKDETLDSWESVEESLDAEEWDLPDLDMSHEPVVLTAHYYHAICETYTTMYPHMCSTDVCSANTSPIHNPCASLVMFAYQDTQEDENTYYTAYVEEWGNTHTLAYIRNAWLETRTNSYHLDIPTHTSTNTDIPTGLKLRAMILMNKAEYTTFEQFLNGNICCPVNILEYITTNLYNVKINGIKKHTMWNTQQFHNFLQWRKCIT